MKVRYNIIEEKLQLEGIAYVSYGIEAYCEKNSVKKVSDVTLDRNEAEELVELCNSMHLSHEHLAEVVENFIS